MNRILKIILISIFIIGIVSGFTNYDKQDLSHFNLHSNGGFEKSLLGWTTGNIGWNETAVFEVQTSQVASGTWSAVFTPSAINQSIETTYINIPSGLQGSSCEATMGFLYGSSDYTLSAVDGNNSVLDSMSLSAYSNWDNNQVLYFTCPTSSGLSKIKIRVATASATANSLYIDNVYVSHSVMGNYLSTKRGGTNNNSYTQNKFLTYDGTSKLVSSSFDTSSFANSSLSNVTSVGANLIPSASSYSVGSVANAWKTISGGGGYFNTAQITHDSTSPFNNNMKMSWYSSGADNYFKIDTAIGNSTYSNVLVLTDNVGIRLSGKPTEKLDVGGNGKFDGNIYPNYSNSYDLGMSNKVWQTGYLKYINLNGSVFTNTDITSWNSVSGKLSVETDPVFTASAAYPITTPDIANWNSSSSQWITSKAKTIGQTDLDNWNTTYNRANQDVKTTSSPTFVTPSITSLNYKAGANNVTIQAPASVPSSYSLTWPSSAGSSMQTLTTDGSGILSWASSSGGISWATGPGSGDTGKVLTATGDNTTAWQLPVGITQTQVVLTGALTGDITLTLPVITADMSIQIVRRDTTPQYIVSVVPQVGVNINSILNNTVQLYSYGDTLQCISSSGDANNWYTY